MAWVELMDAQKPAATEWHLFRHVREQIRDAAQKVPGLNLREMACYVDDGGKLAKPVTSAGCGGAIRINTLTLSSTGAEAKK